MGCAERYLRGAGADLRYAGDLVYRAADRRSSEFRYRPVPDRACSGWLKRPLGIAIELLAAIPSIVYGMWGLFIFAPLFAVYFREPVGNIMSNIPIVGALFSGPAFGIRYPRGRRDPRHHDYSVHCGGNARCIRTNPGDDERVGLRYRLHHTGSYLAYRSSVHQKMVLSAALCWVWGVRSVKPWR